MPTRECPGYTTLANDPKQQHDVIGTHADEAREVHRLLVEFMRETNVPERLLRPRLEPRL